MRAAGPGTHPLTDLLFHGRHPFPQPVEHLILEIHAVNPSAWREFAEAAEGWARIREDAPEVAERLTVVAPGSTFDVGLPVRAVGELHAVIHPEFPRITNSGYVVDAGRAAA